MISEGRLDRSIGLVLHVGMLLSVMVLAAGLAIFALDPVPVESIPINHLPEELMEGSPMAIIGLGILLLIMTPITRVIAAAAVFAAEREPRFVLVALGVLAVIILATVI